MLLLSGARRVPNRLAKEAQGPLFTPVSQVRHRHGLYLPLLSTSEACTAAAVRGVPRAEQPGQGGVGAAVHACLSGVSCSHSVWGAARALLTCQAVHNAAYCMLLLLLLLLLLQLAVSTSAVC